MSEILMNEEQRAAITHGGGALLEAGAGSGKTFVLVEHVLHILKNFQGERKDIVKKLSGLVLMTFTRKAAGEISLRLKERIRALQEGPDGAYWKTVEECLSHLTVSTIHGFCHRIITRGILPNLSADIELVSESKGKNKVEKLFSRWLDQCLEPGTALKTPQEKAVLNLFLESESRIKEALVQIFGDPLLRKMWRDLPEDDFGENHLHHFFRDYFSWENFGGIWDIDLDVHSSLFTPHAKLQWFRYLKDMEEFKATLGEGRGIGLAKKENFYKLLEIQARYERIPPPPRQNFSLGPMDLQEYWKGLKGFRTFLSDHGECFTRFFEQGPQFKIWFAMVREMIGFIEEHYREDHDFTFSDLEYYVLLALESPAAEEQLGKIYKYFIVDEFQDTSQIQFSLIKKFIGGDFSRLFCVGDAKQAIYGFRGGDLRVFSDCQSSVKDVLRLRNNYRSSPRVVEFNNRFFGFLFDLGHGFEGQDLHRVEFIPQVAPSRAEEFSGETVKIKLDWGELQGLSFNSQEANRWEAVVLSQRIEEIQKKFPGENIAVLYKNLPPSQFLVSSLLSQGKSFRAQVKIPFREDPVMGIFQTLVEKALEKKGSRPSERPPYYFQEVLLKTYLSYLQIPPAEGLSTALIQFFSDLAPLGVYSSFQKFIYALGISNSHSQGNMGPLEEICRFCGEDLGRIFDFLGRFGEDKYSMDFEFGPSPDEISIMTTHGAKGLEFSHVLLGGLPTNGHERGDSPFLGKLPGSFKWKAQEGMNELFKSPYYLLEEEINRGRNFSESKRLFYVACTRAKKTLTFVDLNFPPGFFSIPRNSWIKGLYAFEDFLSREGGDPLLLTVVDFPVGEELLRSQGSPGRVPLFHSNPLGLAGKTGSASSPGRSLLGLMGDLSVTGLSTVEECPRKFYLENVCRFTEEERDFLKGLGTPVFSPLQGPPGISTKERGTFLHLLISRWIEGENPMEEREEGEEGDKKVLDWVLPLLQNLRKDRDYELKSEVSLKFSLFGQNISGAADLMGVPRERSSPFPFLLWDFKSGRRDPVKEASYWTQVYVYAYGLYSLGQISRTDEIQLGLVYLDEQQLLERKLAFPEVKELAQKTFEKLAFLDQVNPESCPHCPYSFLCRGMLN